MIALLPVEGSSTAQGTDSVIHSVDLIKADQRVEEALNDLHNAMDELSEDNYSLISKVEPENWFKHVVSSADSQAVGFHVDDFHGDLHELNDTLKMRLTRSSMLLMKLLILVQMMLISPFMNGKAQLLHAGESPCRRFVR